ncbi:hypothetical protein ACFE04_001875 [Oxalis oulophora]
MASKKKQSEGIALLSMYNDEEDDDMEDLEEEEETQNDELSSKEELNREEEDTSMDMDGITSPSNQQQQHDTLVNSADVIEFTNNNNNNNDDFNDPLDKFLPPPPKTKCSELLQRKIERFIDLKKARRSFNAEVRNRKDYRNPDFLLHAVKYQDIDQIGSCFHKDVFDPHGYDPSDFYDEIEADMKRERERKEQELKRSPKVDFISGGIQPVPVTVAAKFNVPIPGGLSSVPSSVDAVPKDGRQNKKSKWDKVDSDVKNHVPSGSQDSSLSGVGAHAALLSAANAGAGYMAFAQQRRREAEERRSSEWKSERKS